MASKTLGTELADLEFRRISTIAWPTIAILFSIQALTSESDIRDWQIYYIIGITLTVGLSILIQRISNLSHPFIPFALYMLLAPVVLGDLPTSPWMSYGLLTVAASIYVATINPWPFAIAGILALSALQIWTVNIGLTSFTDQRDMKLLGGYFATIWMMGIGFLISYIRNQYLMVTSSIENQIDSLKESISKRLQGITKQNRDDSRNLKLHGTVLNTLIYARNNSDYLNDRKDITETLGKEILEMRNDRPAQSLKLALIEMLNQRENNRVKIESMDVTGEVNDSHLQNAYKEVMREIFLNIEKHTRATVASVNISFDEDRRHFIEICDNSYLYLDQAERENLRSKAARSKSLLRLLELIPAQLSITSSTDGLIYRISSTTSTESAASSLEIHQSRNEGLLSFAFNLIKSVSIIGILYIPGYLFLEIDPIKVLLLITQAITLFLLAYRKTFSAVLLAISTWISIATPVFISFDVTNCSEVLFTPWMANIALTATLSFALLSKHRIQRWIPLAIFTLELLILPLTYPDGCKNIYAGTLPGIPFIISFYLVINSIRKRAFTEDSRQIRAAYEDEINVEKTEALLDFEFNAVLSNLEQFNRSISEIKQSDLIPELDLQIQRLRAFLICSEQFESQVVRDFYEFAVKRISGGKSTRISLLGDHFFMLDSRIDTILLFSQLNEVLENQPVEIVLLRFDSFMIEIIVSDPDKITKKATELFLKFPQTKFAIRSFS